MKFFIDTAEIEEIKSLSELGLVDGVTTNPSLIYKSGKDFKKVIKEISTIVEGPISAEVTSTECQEMIAQGQELAKISNNIVIKVPLTADGLMACKKLSSNNIKVNVTLCFSASQALLAGKLGATYISPFIGRLDDIGTTGLNLIKEIVHIYNTYKKDIKTEVLAASIRSPLQVSQVASMGAHVATIPPKIIYQMIKHPLTDIGLDTFMNDWKKTGQKF
ncbi:MAG: fructose-6-phosphate aldolase [Alphaproteobacteria bacterium TMED93]|jgi:transaldolase|nr:MAG: fructose-6-phosphate aldolase [Alphaproteobacteria bacterium TMED93]|tara:strand:+ start:2318 stop:2974 length:657 start_codon:yes stop_codon:yes gene_type:complete